MESDYFENSSHDGPAPMTRRSLFQRTALAIAAASLPRSLQADQENPKPSKQAAANDVIGELSAYMGAAGDRALPADVAEKAKHHLLDTIAAMISGVDLAPAQVALRFARAHAAEKTATVVGTDLLCGALEAAMVNGVLVAAEGEAAMMATEDAR